MLIAIVAGLLIGIVVGALGGGGAILALPVLVFALGQTPHEGATGSLVIVGITSAIAMLTHARSGRVHWRDGFVFGLIGIAGTWFGTELARQVDGRSLLIAFAVLLLGVSVIMWRRAHQAEGRPAPQDAPPAGVEVGAEGAADEAGTAGVRSRRVPALLRNRAASIMAAATAVGLLTGFFGVGGGFAVVPTLVLALGFPMREAVATSLLVLTLNTASALGARALGDGLAIDWSVIAPFTAAAVAGSFLGAVVGGRVRPALLQQSFAVLLVLVSLYTGVRALGLVG